jgi:hypothetical protein
MQQQRCETIAYLFVVEKRMTSPWVILGSEWWGRSQLNGKESGKVRSSDPGRDNYSSGYWNTFHSPAQNSYFVPIVFQAGTWLRRMGR